MAEVLKHYASLHMHSTHSDGVYTPKELVEVGRAEGDLALYSRAEEESRGVAEGVKQQEQKIVTERGDDGGDDESPDRDLKKSETCRLEPLSLYHHTGLQRLDGYLHDLCRANHEANQNRVYRPESFYNCRHNYLLYMLAPRRAGIFLYSTLIVA